MFSNKRLELLMKRSPKMLELLQKMGIDMLKNFVNPAGQTLPSTLPKALQNDNGFNKL